MIDKSININGIKIDSSDGRICVNNHKICSKNLRYTQPYIELDTSGGMGGLSPLYVMIEDQLSVTRINSRNEIVLSRIGIRARGRIK